MENTARPRIEVTIAAPVEVVWDALRSKETIRQWMGWDYDGLDGEIDLIFFTGTEEDPSAGSLRLHGGDEFTLEANGDSTGVTLIRAPRGQNPELDPFYGDITDGWITFVQQLKFAVERHSGADRRTLSFVGSNANAVQLIDELGLSGLFAGTPFRITLLGENVAGDVWFRSDEQLGITVDAWGDGLLIVSSADPTPGKPQGSAMAILSTYDLDDARLAGLDTRWRQWWTERFPVDR